jgi:hypothetical protein
MFRVYDLVCFQSKQGRNRHFFAIVEIYLPLERINLKLMIVKPFVDLIITKAGYI